MPVHDLLSRVKRLIQTRGSELASLLSDGAAEWDEHKENAAQLLEVQRYALDLQWIDRTTDPNDEEVKRQRAQALREGRKPPERPIIPPVALRPKALSELRVKNYEKQIALHKAQNGPGLKSMSRVEFEKAMGIEP